MNKEQAHLHIRSVAGHLKRGVSPEWQGDLAVFLQEAINVLDPLCAMPDCERPPRQRQGPGRPTRYCTDHQGAAARVTASRRRQAARQVKHQARIDDELTGDR